jgi:hypothetical protein
VCREWSKKPWNVKKVQYSWTKEQLEALYKKQKGKCAICHKPFTRKENCVDHDHACCAKEKSCGKCVRGLLCRSCNNGISFLKESEEVMRSAIAYLKMHKRRMQ